MMNEKQIQIKERTRGYFTKGFFFLALMTLSLLYALYPVISAREVSGETYYYALGGGAFAIFTGFFAFLLYKEFKPDNAFLLNAHGFTDIYNVGKDVEIEWTNVASVKIIGSKEAPFLGITLEDSDIVMSKMSKNKCEVMRENIEEGLPSILVSHSDIRIPVSELKDLFTKFIRESRILDKDSVKKTKTNPFSTDDVLRAFGKLPEEEKTDDIVEVIEESQEEIAEDIIETITPEETTVEETPVEETEPTTNAEIIEQLLVPEQKIENDKPEEVIEEIEIDSDDEMPQELKDILAMAKSSKITELEKMLSDNQSFSIDFEPENEVVEEKTSNIDIQNDDDIVAADETKDDEFIVPEYIAQDTANDVPEEINVVEALDEAPEEAVEEIVENAVEDIVEDVVEDVVEDEVIDVVEEEVIDVVEDEVVDDIIEEVNEDIIEDVSEEVIENVAEEVVEEAKEIVTETETKTKTNDVVRTNIPDLHIPEEFFDEKDSMIDTQEIKMEMNIETVVNNAFDVEQSAQEPLIDFSNISEIDVSDYTSDIEETTIIEPQDDQGLQLDLDDTDDTDETDGELGFITDLD